jgi:hypothetical protein
MAIKTSYRPVPRYIRTWVEDDWVKALVIFDPREDTESTLSVWDPEEGECLHEITITERTYKEIYKISPEHDKIL